MIGRLKTAAEVQESSLKKQKKIPDTTSLALKHLALGGLGLGAGTAAGYGAGHGLNWILKKTRGTGVTPSTANILLPLLGAGLGTSYGLWNAHVNEERRRALEAQRNQPE